MGKSNRQVGLKRLVSIALIFAMALVLSLIEGIFPIFAVGTVKIGLSNIATMYALTAVDMSAGISIAILKSLFVLFIRGFVAACLSICGGIFSILAMYVVYELFTGKYRYTIMGTVGGLFHNLGQLLAAVLVVNTSLILLLPVLSLAGVFFGIATGTMLSVVIPRLKILKINEV